MACSRVTFAFTVTYGKEFYYTSVFGCTGYSVGSQQMRYNQALGFYEESYLSVDAEGGNSPSKQRFVVPCGASVNVSRGCSVFPKCDKYCKN
jgi:hypothetical protein